MSNRYYNFFSMLFLALMLGGIYVPQVFAVENQAMQWTNINSQGSFFKSSKWLYLFNAESRYNFNPDKLERQILAGGLGYQYTSNLSFWGAYQWDSRNYLTGAPEINRLLQQLIWRSSQDSLVLQLRSRIEERWLQNQPQWNIRFRQMLRLEWPKILFNQLDIILWNESFLNFNNPPWTSDKTYEQNRAFIGVSVPIAKPLAVEIGYLNRYLFRSAGGHMSNILYIVFNVRPDI